MTSTPRSPIVGPSARDGARLLCCARVSQRRHFAPRDPPSSDDAAAERIDACDVGLAADRPLPWRFHAAARWSPVVVSFPHVGLAWPAELGPPPAADFARNADFEVQSLYADAAEQGAACIEAVYSRLLVDLNRAGDDISSAIVPDHPAPRPRRRPGLPNPGAESTPLHGDPMRPGRGVVWAQALGNVPLLTKPLRYAEFQARIDHFHEPYYRALEILLERRRRRFGYAILLDAHSMPCSVGVDLVLGTLANTSCARDIEALALDALGDASPDIDGCHDVAAATPRRSQGQAQPRPRLRVRLNDPYHGGELVHRFGRPTDGLHALQLEVSRGLYMDERTSTLWSVAPHSTPATMPMPTPMRGRTSMSPAHTAKAHDPTQPPSAKHAADFAELRRRVSCLIRALTRGLDDRSIVGTSPSAVRATEADLGSAP